MIRRTLSGLLGVVLLVSAEPVSAQAPELLEGAIRAYTERGDARETVRQLGTALDAGAIPSALEPRARMYMGHAFLALGDTLSAMPHIESALSAEPCLVPAPDLTPPQWSQLYERVRPRGVSCRPRALTSTLQSILVPGWGQRSVGRTGPSRYFFFSTAMAGGGAYLLHSHAENRIEEYRTSTDPVGVADLYDSAERSRRFAVMVGGLAGALYVWNVIDAVVGGASHDRDLARVRRLSFLPAVIPTESGVRVAVHIPLN